MGEDYENDQARFTEVTDKELEAFQKVVTEIATGKEEPDTLTAEGVAKILGDFANRSSARSDKELAEALGNQHRTLQQAITRIFVEWMRHLHGQAGQLGHYDDRNEASVMLAHAMFEDIAPEKLYLPLI
jgi:hypothetical protein